MLKRSKKIQKMLTLFDNSKSYSIEDAIGILRKFEEFRNFPSSVEMTVLMEKTKDNKSNRFVFNLVHGIPQNLKILAVVNSTMERKLKEDIEEGIRKEINERLAKNPQNKSAEQIEREVREKDIFRNLHIGGEEMLTPIITTNKTDFNSILCTPEMFSKITKHARALGQLRLMPSSKTGTVIEDIMGGVRSLLLGTIQKVKKDVNTLRLKIANCSFENNEIKDNFMAVLDGIKNEAGAGSSGIISISIKLSMTPSVKVLFN